MNSLLLHKRVLTGLPTFLWATLLLSHCVCAEEIVKLKTNGTTHYVYVMPNPNARASIILFRGGNGKLKLHKGRNKVQRDNNFLIRSRQLFFHNGFNVLLFDAPKKLQRGNGLLFGYRTRPAHAAEIRSVINYSKKRFNQPVWLAGTSRGTESVAYAAVKQVQGIHGIILTASMSEANHKGKSLPELGLKKINLPVFIATHKHDECHVTPASGTYAIAKQLTNAKNLVVKSYTGGKAALSKPCKARSAHGFFGIEAQVVNDISRYIHSNTK